MLTCNQNQKCQEQILTAIVILTTHSNTVEFQEGNNFHKLSAIFLKHQCVAVIGVIYSTETLQVFKILITLLSKDFKKLHERTFFIE